MAKKRTLFAVVLSDFPIKPGTNKEGHDGKEYVSWFHGYITERTGVLLCESTKEKPSGGLTATGGSNTRCRYMRTQGIGQRVKGQSWMADR